MKKTSKRIFSVAISLILVFLMAITSSAATITSVVAGVGTDADRTVQVTVQYASPEEAQESTLLVVKKGVSIVTAKASDVRYIDQKTVDGNSVTYTFKMAADDRVGDYDLYVGGTKVDAPASTAISFSTDATTTIKFVDENGTEIASQVLVSSNLGDIIDLTSYAPETITSGTSIYKKDATNPANFTVSATTNEVTITYTYDSEVPKETKQFVVYGITYNTVSENLVPNGTFETNTEGWISWDGSGALGSFSRSTAQAHSGDYSLKSDVDGGGTSAGSLVGQFDLDADVKSGDKYVLSFWSYSNNAGMTLTTGLGTDKSSVQVDIDCGGLGNSGTDPISCNLSGMPTNQWRQHIYVLTAKADSTFAEIYARWLGTGTYFDDVELYKVEQVYNNYEIGDEVENDGVTYQVASDNLITNGSFEDANGDFSMEGWLTQSTSVTFPNTVKGECDYYLAANEHGFYFNRTEPYNFGETYNWTNYNGPKQGNATDGDWYIMTQWEDNFGGLCSIKRSFALETGKTYLFMYDIKHNTGGTQSGINAYVGPTLAAGAGTQPGDISMDWKTVSYYVTADGTNNTLWFNEYASRGTCFDNFRLYELEVPQTVFDVTVTYTAGGKTVKTETKSYDSAVADGATFEGFTYAPDGGNYIYTAETQVVSESKTIEMTQLANADVNGYAKGGTYATATQVYKIVSDNLIPNGNFGNNLTGWLNGSGAAPATNLTVNGNGTVTSTLHDGNGGNGCLYRSWAIEAGATYLFTFYTSSTNAYQQFTLSNSLGTDESRLIVGNGNGYTAEFGNPAENATGSYVFTNTEGYDYAKIRFRWNGTNTFGNFGLYKIEEDASQKATTTIKFVDSSNTSTEIANAVTVNGIIGSTIDLTDTSIVPEAITYNGNVYSKDSTNATNHAVVTQEDVITITYTTDAITEIDTVNVTVIDGNAPILPKTLGAKTGAGTTATVTVTSWDTSSLKVGTNTVYGTIDGLEIKAEANVTVLENTFDVADITTVNGQDAGKSSQVEFPVAISDEFSIEFTANYASFGDLWITLKTADAGFFGPEQIPLGVNASGAFRPVNGNGSGSRAADDFDHVKLTTGVNYRFFITTDASTDKYSVTVTDEATGEVVDAFENYGYRTNATAIEAITSLTNNGAGSVTLTNIKVSAPSADVDTYTVNAVAGNTTLGTFTGVASDTSKLGYNNQVVYPNVTIPSYDGYVFKNKTVSGTTVTLNYEAVEEAGFFDNVANDTKFVSLNMLGAHDAFTSSISSSNAKFDAAGTAQGDSGSKSAVSSAAVAAPMSKAQSADVLTMLNYGVRYFDIRLSRSDTTAKGGLLGLTTVNHTNAVFYTTHGMLSDEFRPIAYTIAQWAKAHPGEIIVLDFQEMWDNTSTAGSSGNSVAQSWTDLNNLLTEAGIYDYVTINNSTDLSAVTYGSLTNNGEKAGIVLFGRAVATNASVGSFILRGDTSAAFNGKMYSNYSFGGASVSSSSLANTYIQAQVDHAYTQTGTVNNMYRVMQAISSTSDLINQADDDNTFITNAVQTNPTWLTTLPVIMVNDATVNTSDLLAILKACNEPVDVTMNYTIGGTVADTNTTKLMVGTLYTGTVVGALVSGLNGEYAVTEALGETPVPYNGSITLAVEKLGNVYSTRIENNVHSVYSGNLDDAAVYAGKTNFAAYTWGQDNDRLGVAVLSAEKGKDNYVLSANVVRSDFNQSYRNVKFYVLPVSEYRALNLQDKNALLAKLNDNTLVADINPDNYGVGMQTIVLDAAKIAQAAEGGDVVIIGNAQGGLYGMEGASMAIVSGYNVTINGSGATIAYGTYTLPSDAIAYHKEGTTEVYKPGSTAPITADTNFVPYYALGADMVNGAQVRIGDGVDENGKVSTGSGLRFLTTVNRTDALASLADEGVEMEFGVEVTAEGSSAAPVVIKAVEWQVDNAVFTSAVTNLAEGNYNRKYTATPYIKIGENVFYGTPVTRSIYQVAAGLLANPDADNTDYDDVVLASKPLYDVLNAYVNQTGVRLTLSDISETATLTARTGEAKGAYTGEAFFTVGATTYADGKYTVTLTAVGKSEINTKLFNEYVRINNNNSLVSPVTTITDNGDKTYTIVFDYSNMQQ